ncbi:PDZ and LIM domain protein 1 isoform X1 [Rhineura floridana]|uniref:PDZ and LIM domain protein 1 isoform X1 n=1 Tax=Rhineura floridana TaxID=261503 RepID=UPI002AC8221F|nr:PDZ and LIM domain protein 1 isoform X1 [Rhineura floridana]
MSKTHCVVIQGPGPWGFRLVGGKDFDQPLTISRVTPGSKAATANLCTGDVIMAIDGENTENMTHLEAQNKIKGCIDEIILTVGRTESKIWSPLITEEGKTNRYKMNLASQPQDIRHIGSAHNRSAMPFTATTNVSGTSPKVITAQYNSPAGLYSSENMQTFNEAMESKASLGDQESSKNLDQLNQPSSNLVINRDSEVYKMLQENQDSNEPPRQSTSFLMLQEILESEEKGDPSKTSGFRSVKAPTTKIAASIGNSQKLPVCEKCGSGIVGAFLKLRDKHLHPECYVCSDCGINLKQKGHFFVEDCIYCEKHARERATPPEGYEVITVFPK